jgi:hypothetical protein
MKTYFAYDVNPRLLMKLLNDAKQPIIGIRIQGPATTQVPMACVGCEDNADDGIVSGIISKISGKRPSFELVDRREQELRRELES